MSHSTSAVLSIPAILSSFACERKSWLEARLLQTGEGPSAQLMELEQRLLRLELATLNGEPAGKPAEARSLSEFLALLRHGPLYGIRLRWNRMDVRIDRAELIDGAVQTDTIYPQPRVPGSHQLWLELLRRILGTGVSLLPPRTWTVDANARRPAPLLQEVRPRLGKPQDRALDRAEAIIFGQEPPAELKWACKRCPFRWQCFSPDEAQPILDLPKLNRGLYEELVQEGVRLISELDPEDVRLGRSQKRAIQAASAEALVMDEPGVQARIQQLQWPVSFLDFEATTGLVPLLPGTAPFAQVPFQYSIQVQLEPGGPLQRKEFLAPLSGDWRPGLARRLSRDLPRAGSIVAWGAAFEDKCLREISGWDPKASWLKDARARLFDLHPLVRDLVSHPAMRGRSSLKAALPALGNSAGYSELPIADGRAAASAFALLRLARAGEHAPGTGVLQRLAIRRQLRNYCALDTRALSEILTALRTTSYPPS